MVKPPVMINLQSQLEKTWNRHGNKPLGTLVVSYLDYCDEKKHHKHKQC